MPRAGQISDQRRQVLTYKKVSVTGEIGGGLHLTMNKQINHEVLGFFFNQVTGQLLLLGVSEFLLRLI